MLGDCLDRMSEIADGSVDMILADLPYGTTACAWDSIIPFEPLWAHYWRVAKPNAAVVLTASQPFTSALVMSQIERFKYEWIWGKNRSTGFLNAKKRPLVTHESVCVFGCNQQSYYPQMTLNGDENRKHSNARSKIAKIYSAFADELRAGSKFCYPISLQFFNVIQRPLHPTQKPVELFEYLIRTYTEPGALILDNVAGSGTTAIAAENTERRWICIERDAGYYNAALARVANRVLLP